MDHRMPLVVMTSPKTDWTLAGFFHQLNQYAEYHQSLLEWCRPMVWGYESKPRNLSREIEFFSIGSFEDYPVYKWSNSFLHVAKKMKGIGYKSFWFMLDDYWITRQIDVPGLLDLWNYHNTVADSVFKIDLAFDRLYADYGFYNLGMNTVRYVGHMDIIESQPTTNYYMSLWGGLFSAPLIKEAVAEGWTAQEVELNGTPLLRTKPYVVYGTRQGPVVHTNVCHSGRFFDFAGPPISEEDMRALRSKKMTNGH